MAEHAEVPETDETREAAAKERLDVSELLADRAAAPSPFGDDQTFPLPVERLTYVPTVTS